VQIESPGTSESEAPAAKLPADMTASQEQTLKSQLVDTAKLVGAKEALDWGHLTQAAAVKTGAPQEPELPDQSDIDVAKLTVPVLTRQGWILPLPENDPRTRYGQR
jgi:hypothetical protein